MEAQKILEWYIEAGVDETIGESPIDYFLLSQEKQKTPSIPVVEAVSKQALPQSRPATIASSTPTPVISNNARDLCDKCSSLNELRTALEAFDECSLKLTATNLVFGEGNPNAKLMIIGEAPGAEEDKSGQPFVGKSGQLLTKMLKSINIERKDVYISNILPWRPPGNRKPTIEETAICLPFIQKHIDLVSPDILLLLGGSSASSLCNTSDGISQIRGKKLNYTTSNGKEIIAIPTFHPAYLLRTPAQKAKIWQDLLNIKSILN